MIYIVTTVNDENIYNICINSNICLKKNNVCIKSYSNIAENIPVPVRYNSFLNSFDYNTDAWICFCHPDWEILEDINNVVKDFDINSIYGPIGVKLNTYKEKYIVDVCGYCEERYRDGRYFRCVDKILDSDKKNVDTLDCQAVFVHSSLIDKYNLRFDEKLKWHLYVEDFCISAKVKYNINTYATKIKCCHWCGWHDDLEEYNKTLSILNEKYPNDLFGATVSTIGGKKMEMANPKETMLYNLSKKVRTNAKN